MEEILARQADKAKKVTGKSFVMNVVSIVLYLAAAQLLCNLLIMRTGKGIFNILFYLYAIGLMIHFMRRTVAGYAYTLKEKTLILERRLGDSTTSVVEIPLDSVAAMRPVHAAERLKTSYRQVTVIDPAAAPGFRMHAAMLASLLSARLARKIAGEEYAREIGFGIVFDENGQRRVCVFCPNDEMCAALKTALGSRWMIDERLSERRTDTLYAKALKRAFPSLYINVEPLITQEDLQWADSEKERRDKKKEARNKAIKARLSKKKRS